MTDLKICEICRHDPCDCDPEVLKTMIIRLRDYMNSFGIAFVNFEPFGKPKKDWVDNTTLGYIAPYHVVGQLINNDGEILGKVDDNGRVSPMDISGYDKTAMAIPKRTIYGLPYNIGFSTVLGSTTITETPYIIENHGPDVPEQPPVHNNMPHAWDLVVHDMAKRKAMGFEKYKTHLQPFNGRKALWDAYQEVLDLIVYLRQYIYEIENPQDKPFETINDNLEEL